MPARSSATILQIIPRLDTGGAELSTLEIVAALVRSGGRALVATEGGRMANEVTRLGGELIPFPAGTKNPARLAANARRLSRFMQAERVDLIHARSRAPAWSALWAARRAGVPFVTTYHGAYSEENAVKRWYNSVMARADRVIANSAYTAGLVRSRYGTGLDRLRIVNRGIDPARFDPAGVSAHAMADLRNVWGVESGSRIILNAARLTGWKGQGVIIEAAGRLAAEHRLGDTHIVLVGDDQGRTGYREQLVRQAHARGISDRVKLVGHCDDMPAAFRLADIAVVASTEPEAFGRAAIEAQAMGCPVIATDIGAPSETVRTDQPGNDAGQATGWLVPPNDARAMAEAMGAALALSADEILAMGGRARRHVLAQYTVPAMQQATLAVYDELLHSDLARCFADADSMDGPTPAAGPAPT